jgi:Rad3-related DNA helicase
MMEIQPIKGNSWVVNQDHVLTLVCTNSQPDHSRPNGEIVDVTVREWLTWSKSQKHLYKLFRVPVERSGFKVVPTGTIEPFFGFILDGDGRYLLDDFTVTHNSGKSLIAAAAQRIFKERFLYCCINKGLQAQFTGDFAYDLDGKEYAVELKGRANYPTLRYPHLFPNINASMCTGKKEVHCRWCCDGRCNPEDVVDNGGNTICFAKVECPYRVQKARALHADLAVVNIALFLYEANFVGQFSGWPWMVIDEADRLEGALMDFIQLEITRRWIDRLNLEPPARKTVETAWIDWAEHIALPAVNEELAKLKGQYGVEDMRREQELERMQKKLAFFLNEIQVTKWVFLGEDDRWTFKPVFISRYADRQLWRHASRFILMSATIVSPDEMAHSLGIPRDEIEFIDLPSTFPPERRPIYYLPAGNLTWKTEDSEFPKVVAALDKILDKTPHVKVLVHTVSYARAKKTVSLSRHKKRMLSYDQARDRESRLEEFKNAAPDAVLVASSMDRGIDLPGDLCRMVVVLKFPYLNTKDKQVAARINSDKKGGQLWLTVNGIRTLVQMTGRASRSADDYCEIYILDEQFDRIYRENKYLFPQYWRDALKIPKP